MENQPVKFEIVGEIDQVETIASGRGVKIRAHLQKTYGKGRWRKLKGVANGSAAEPETSDS
jgi:hypothetical protein